MKHLEEVLYRLKRNPVLMAAVAGAVQALVTGATVRAALVLGVGLVVRQFTVPAHEVDPKPEEVE